MFGIPTFLHIAVWILITSDDFVLPLNDGTAQRLSIAAAYSNYFDTVATAIVLREYPQFLTFLVEVVAFWGPAHPYFPRQLKPKRVRNAHASGVKFRTITKFLAASPKQTLL